jgi:FtsH-binding integral membrane protein
MAQNTWETVFPATFSGSGPDFSAMLKANNISARVQNHLRMVYMTLAATMAAAVAGTVFYLYTHVTPILSTICMMILLFGLTLERRDVPVESRLPRLLLFGFCQGASVGSLVEVALSVSPMVVAQSFIVTVLVFGCFAGVATFSERRSMLYMYGIIASGMSWLMFASFANFFLQSSALFGAEVYLGLAMFIGYVCADSQMIIERADLGDDDYIRHSLELFLDFVAIFIRILVIFLRSRAEERSPQSRKKRRE